MPQFTTRELHYLRQGLEKLVLETNAQKAALASSLGVVSQADDNNINTLIEYYDRRAVDISRLICKVNETSSYY